MEDLELKLVDEKWVTIHQLELAKQEAVKCGKSLWVALVKLGYIPEDDIAAFFAQESNISYVRFSDYKIQPEILALLDEDFCRQNSVIPLFKIKDVLFVVCNNPLDTVLMDRVTKLTGCSIELLAASTHSINAALNLYHGLEDRLFDFGKFIIKQVPLQGVSFWRESERLALNIPVSLKIEDSSCVLRYSSIIKGCSRDISSNGTAVGLEVFLFLPKGVNVSLEFNPNQNLSGPGEIIRAEGEIVHSRMEKAQRYFLGVKITEIEKESYIKLLQLATSSY
ncbi:MAG: PilZ domain-containing protein [Candidatus Omnitrophota bacterium]